MLECLSTSKHEGGKEGGREGLKAGGSKGGREREKEKGFGGVYEPRANEEEHAAHGQHVAQSEADREWLRVAEHELRQTNHRKHVEEKSRYHASRKSNNALLFTSTNNRYTVSIHITTLNVRIETQIMIRYWS